MDAAAAGGVTSLHVAASNGHVGAVEALLHAEADVNLTDDNGSTVLHSAAASSLSESNEILKMIGKKSRKIDAVDKHGRTPLHIACGMKSAENVELLLDWGATLGVVKYKKKLNELEATEAHLILEKSIDITKNADDSDSFWDKEPPKNNNKVSEEEVRGYRYMVFFFLFV